MGYMKKNHDGSCFTYVADKEDEDFIFFVDDTFSFVAENPDINNSNSSYVES